MEERAFSLSGQTYYFLLYRYISIVQAGDLLLLRVVCPVVWCGTRMVIATVFGVK